MVQFKNENNHIKQNYQTLCKVKNKNTHKNVNDNTSAQFQIENNHTKWNYQMRIKMWIYETRYNLKMKILIQNEIIKLCVQSQSANAHKNVNGKTGVQFKNEIII